MTIIKIRYMLAIIIAYVMLAFRFPRRRFFILRTIVSACVYSCVVLFVPDEISWLKLPISLNIISSLTCLGFATVFLFDVSLNCTMFTIIVSAILQHMGQLNYRLIGILIIPDEVIVGEASFPFNCSNTYRIVYIFGFLILYFVIWFMYVFKKREQILSANFKSWQIILLSGLLFIIVLWLGNVAVDSEMRCNILYLIPTLLCCFASLGVLFMTNKSNTLQTEAEIAKNLLVAEQKHYESMRASMETVNGKFHDMKYQIMALNTTKSVQREDIIVKLQNEIGTFENLAQTGNIALDNILDQKLLVCENKKICFSYMADGSAIDFMEASDIFVMFGNALDNAIECVEKSKERRNIHLGFFKRGNLLRVSIENDCDEQPNIKNGVLLTSKSDGINHGFGTKSIIRIAEKYGG